MAAAHLPSHSAPPQELAFCPSLSATPSTLVSRVSVRNLDHGQPTGPAAIPSCWCAPSSPPTTSWAQAAP